MSPFISNEFSSTVAPSHDDYLQSETLTPSQAIKKADLVGPGIGNYAELQNVLPSDYNPLLARRETQKAIFQLRRYIEDKTPWDAS